MTDSELIKSHKEEILKIIKGSFVRNCSKCNNPQKIKLSGDKLLWECFNCVKSNQVEVSEATLRSVKKILWKIQEQELEDASRDYPAEEHYNNESEWPDKLLVEKYGTSADHFGTFDYQLKSGYFIIDADKLDGQLYNNYNSKVILNAYIPGCLFEEDLNEKDKDNAKKLKKSMWGDGGTEQMAYDFLNIIIHEPKTIKMLENLDLDAFFFLFEMLEASNSSIDIDFLQFKWELSLQNPDIWKKDPGIPIDSFFHDKNINYCDEYIWMIINILIKKDPMLYAEVVNNRLSLKEAWEKTPRPADESGCIKCNESPRLFLISHECKILDKYSKSLSINSKPAPIRTFELQIVLDKHLTAWSCKKCHYRNKHFANTCNYCDFEASNNDESLIKAKLLRKDYEKRIKAEREKEVNFQENMLIKNEDFKLGIDKLGIDLESKPYLSIDPDEIIFNAEDFKADQDIDDELPF
jgi:hypothetical protein